MSMNSEKTLYKKNTEPVLTKELFQNPTSEYRGTPFWAWNCKITKELIDSQLDCFEKMGFGGAICMPELVLKRTIWEKNF